MSGQDTWMSTVSEEVNMMPGFGACLCDDLGFSFHVLAVSGS